MVAVLSWRSRAIRGWPESGRSRDARTLGGAEFTINLPPAVISQLVLNVPAWALGRVRPGRPYLPAQRCEICRRRTGGLAV